MRKSAFWMVQIPGSRSAERCHPPRLGLGVLDRPAGVPVLLGELRGLVLPILRNPAVPDRCLPRDRIALLGRRDVGDLIRFGATRALHPDLDRVPFRPLQPHLAPSMRIGPFEPGRAHRPVYARERDVDFEPIV